jgi:hypothetical protein
MKLMLRLSSLPAQAASAIGRIRIAARFADIPNCNPSFENPTSEEVLALPQMKGNLHFSFRTDPAATRRRPNAMGGRHGVGRMSAGAAGDMWIKPLLAGRRQPRLAGCVTCLTAIFEP